MPAVPELIIPDWPAPSGVRCAITTRQGGCSLAPYDSFNMAHHVGDRFADMQQNRTHMSSLLNLPSEPYWLNQVHGSTVVECPAQLAEKQSLPTADAAVAYQPGQVCAVMTADCLPVLFCDRSGTRVAAAHAGWRGLAGGVLEATVKRLALPGAQLMAWLGPAIGPAEFEVGPEVRECFLTQDHSTEEAFVRGQGDRWYADIYALARLRLGRIGLGYIGGGEYCTVAESERFFSYRREGVCGRMASLIWLEATALANRQTINGRWNDD